MHHDPESCSSVYVSILKVDKVVTYRRYLDRRNLSMGFVVWGPWVFYLCDASQSMMKRQKRGGGAFLPNFQESLILAQIHILWTSVVAKV